MGLIEQMILDGFSSSSIIEGVENQKIEKEETVVLRFAN
jgi:hypothetical protein